MGATVTTGRTAAAFRARSGAFIYCLYEQTYEKNCHPHTPHWSTVYIGKAAGALQKVFDFASSCEGGMLQNRSGQITPEGYLRSWLSELRSPAPMTRDHTVELDAKDDGIRAALPRIPERRRRSSRASRFTDQAERLLETDRTTLSLFEHGEIIAKLLEEHRIAAWRLLADYSRPAEGAARDPSLGIDGEQTKAGVAMPRHPPALVVSKHGDMILRDADGSWRCKGWPYEIMGAHIRSLAPMCEPAPAAIAA